MNTNKFKTTIEMYDIYYLSIFAGKDFKPVFLQEFTKDSTKEEIREWVEEKLNIFDINVDGDEWMVEYIGEGVLLDDYKDLTESIKL